MNDNMNELTQFSPYAGTLFTEVVPGDTAKQTGYREAENEAKAGVGRERDMYCYAPRSGCPDSKQGQVLMVLRDGSDILSAEEAMKRLGLDRLAEEKHFLLLFPNPMDRGWNFAADPDREDDMDYLIRCFAVLRGSKLGVNGFNGMTFYVADSEAASAMLMTFAALKPLNVPAIMVGGFPADYHIPENALNVEVAAWSCNPEATAYLKRANGCGETPSVESDGAACYYGRNHNVRLLVTERPIGGESVKLAWERLFSETRRWQNDTYGTYQARTNFTERGFVGHVRDASLGINSGFTHTWYEYIPPKLRGTREKVPLVFYFHGGGCVPLYGAEQSGWHDVADEENFIVIYPKASVNKMWNAWNDASFPSDEDFMLALVEHIKTVHPIDESRIYVSGFSMGGMMSNAMACAHPELIAAAAPCNAYNSGYFETYRSMTSRILKPGNIMDDLKNKNVLEGEPPSPVRLEADAKKAAFDYRMPVFQISGLDDMPWPIDSQEDSRIETFDYWKNYNNIPVRPFAADSTFESGLKADENFYDGDDGRFLHHRWRSHDDGNPSLYELLLAKRMPHALDLRAPRYAWSFMKSFSRRSDGTLAIAK